MNIHVSIEVSETITSSADIEKTRKIFAEVSQEWQSSGKLIFSGIFTSKRGGIFIFDLESGDELFEFLAPVVDFSRIDVQPLISLETLGKFFQEHSA